MENSKHNGFITLHDIDTIVDLIRPQLRSQPRVGIILGSGLGSLAESAVEAVRISYADLPGWPVSTVEGHVGQLVFGKLENQDVLLMQGRSHYYEGYSISRLGLPVRVMQSLGIEILFVTNAAGGINAGFSAGDLMLITDHINMIGMGGLNPLRGPNLDRYGTRFPDMSQAYDRKLCDLARKVAQESHITLREGVYIALAGPSFETPADLRFLNLIGADAVGMSTVPEVIVARQGGMRVLGFSGISNKANLDGNTVTSHEEVLSAGKLITPQLLTLIRGVLLQL